MKSFRLVLPENSVGTFEGNSEGADAYEDPMLAFCGTCGGALTHDDERSHALCRTCAATAFTRPTFRPGPPDESDVRQVAEHAARIPMTDEALLAYLHGSLAGIVALAPEIAPKKEAAVRRIHVDIADDEPVLALFDDTIFGSAEYGFVVTPHRLAWRNLVGAAESIPWAALDADAMYVSGNRLVFGASGKMIEVGEPLVLDACADAFYVIAISAQAQASANGSGVVPRLARWSAPPHASEAPPPHNHATPPPPHAVSFQSYAVHAVSQRPPAFACWHCKTPLYWNTPQCAHCGATPRTKSWLRTG